MKQFEYEEYLGDGVYASYDGYHIWLDTRAQEPVNRIALEPQVVVAFDRYREALERRLAEYLTAKKGGEADGPDDAAGD